MNLSNAQQSLLTNYNQSSTGLTVSLGYPIRRSFKRLGLSYSLTRSNITTFNDNTRSIFQTLAFRNGSGVASNNPLDGIVSSIITPSFTYSSIDRAVGPHRGRDFNAAVQVAGAGGNVKYFSPVVSLRQFYPMKGLRINREGHNVLGMRLQLAHVEGFGGQVAPPFNRVYGGGESDIRGFDIRSASPYTFIPTRLLFNLQNPDGTLVPRDPSDYRQGNVQIPLPVYRLVTVGGDTSLTSNIEYRIPIASMVTFAFFTDFNVTGDIRASQLRESVLGRDQITAGLYGCPVFTNGSCSGGTPISFPANLLTTAHGTNLVPRMSNGAELQVVLPIVNAPFRIFYAYNPLRLYESLPQKLAVPNTCDKVANPKCVQFSDLFPTSTAGQFSYGLAQQLYGANYILREPRKTFRLSVSTTF